MRMRGTGALIAVAAVMFATPLVPADALSRTATAAPSLAGVVVISEASCGDDWVEITNTDVKRTADISGWWLAQRRQAKLADRYTFPKGKVLKPGARLVVRASSLPFGIGCGSNGLFLMQGTRTLIDVTTVPNLMPGFSWGRIGDAWTATMPTPGADNVAAPQGAVVDRAAWLFDPSKAYSIKLTVPLATIATLVQQPLEYVPAKFQLQDAAGNWLPSTGPMDVGLRVKGSIGSRTHTMYGPDGLNIRDNKVGLKIKFNFSVKGQTFFGLKKITLNSMVQDPTMTHDTLAYAWFRELGLISARTGFANVTINDSLRGLFLDVEAYDDIAMAWRVPALQHVYEAGVIPNAIASKVVYPDLVPAAYKGAFEVDEGDAKDTTDLRNLIDAVSALAPAKSVTTMGTKVHALLDPVLLGTFLAAEKTINHWDGYSGSVPWAPQNFYLVSDQYGRFQFMPWSTDVTWRYLTEEGLDAKGAEHLDRANARMFAYCQSDDMCASAYRRTLAIGAQAIPRYIAWAKDLFTTHTKSRQDDTVRFTGEGASEWGMTEMQDYAKDRPGEIQSYLKTVVTGDVRWVPPALKLAKGTKLASTSLNAYSDVPGTFSYDVTAGTVLKAGKQAVTVTFTPSDATMPAKTKTVTFTIA